MLFPFIFGTKWHRTSADPSKWCHFLILALSYTHISNNADILHEPIFCCNLYNFINIFNVHAGTFRHSTLFLIRTTCHLAEKNSFHSPSSTSIPPLRYRFCLNASKNVPSPGIRLERSIGTPILIIQQCCKVVCSFGISFWRVQHEKR